jgi:hypothetical protein
MCQERNASFEISYGSVKRMCTSVDMINMLLHKKILVKKGDKCDSKTDEVFCLCLIMERCHHVQYAASTEFAALLQPEN